MGSRTLGLGELYREGEKISTTRFCSGDLGYYEDLWRLYDNDGFREFLGLFATRENCFRALVCTVPR